MAKARSHAAQFRALLRVFDLFGHPMRVIIFQRLAACPQSASDLAKTLPIGRSAIVQHLKRLEAARLVSAKTQGVRRVYQIDPAGLGPLEVFVQQHGRRNSPSVPAEPRY